MSFSDIFNSLALLLLSGLAAAIIIHFLYDWSVGADPRRFSLASNIVMDIAVVLFNTVVAFIVSQIIKNIFGLQVWFLSESK